ncbi:MAG: DNA repair protein RecO [Patescibacteria group bacterium]|jgi:DNA repair protein RecO (recombination protein O)
MDETRSTAAIILSRQPYRENDVLVSAYTGNYGRVSLVARGAKKAGSKLAGHIEPLTLADLMIIKGRGFDYVGSAITSNSYPVIRNDLNRLYYAGKVVGLFNRLVKEGQADKNLFFLLSDWLVAFDGLVEAGRELPKSEGAWYFIFFAWKLLAILGYEPEVHNCLLCQKKLSPGQNFFSFRDGGLICRDCEHKESYSGSDSQGHNLLTISDNCVKILRFIFNNDLKVVKKLKLTKGSLEELTILTNNFINFHC